MPRESREARRRRAAEAVRRLEGVYPTSRISLAYDNEFQLLVATILSAQCTDAMVNRVTPALFRRYRTAADFARADARELARAIRPTGYFRQKTKNIQGAARAVRDRFGGRLPRTMDELVTLPGVGRKTANVVLWHAFRRAEGIAVDTHVTRIARLLGFTHSRDPGRIERDLLPLVPPAKWGHFTHLVIDHGRAVCVARRPRCEACALNDLCPSALRLPTPPAAEAGERVRAPAPRGGEPSSGTA